MNNMKNNNRWHRIVGIIVAIILCVASSKFINNQNVTEIDADNTVDNQESKLDAVKFIRTVDGDTIIVEDSNGEHKRESIPQNPLLKKKSATMNTV